MVFWRYLRAGNWPVVAGYVLFVGTMAAGYFYNVTFVQLGLVDLGTRILGMSRQALALAMTLLALSTCLIALLTGWLIQRSQWGLMLTRKLHLAFGVVAVQTILTALAPRMDNVPQFLIWIMVCSASLGVGVPATFSMTTDLIPVRDRGYVAAAITAVAYLLAATLPGQWRIEQLSRHVLLLLVPGTLLLATVLLLASRQRSFAHQWLAELSLNHQQARFARGRFTRNAPAVVRRHFWHLVALMFAIFFIDSLGFLRIIDTPVLVDGAWQSPALTPRLTIGVTHVVSALIAGVLYTHLGQRALFYWIFGIFALTHFTYTFRVWLLPETTSLSLGAPALYATAVSLYTVITFAAWADFATPQTISSRTAIGVALSGWAATFCSTAMALWWQMRGVSLEAHLRSVNALAQLFFIALILAALWPRRQGAT